jgi:FkbM family methyltransferase
MIIKQNWLKQKLRSTALFLFAALENNGNDNFETNGEKRFVDELVHYFIKKQQEKLILFDIGANVGGYSSMLIEKSTSMKIPMDIHVFEPTCACFKLLESKFAASERVFLHRKAISNSQRNVSIFYDLEKSGLASLYKRNLDAYSITLDQSEIVETMRLDTYLHETDIKHINLLKIDIEGHELSAFLGMGTYLDSGFVDFIQFEYGGANLDSHTSLMEFYTLFENAGFRIAKIMPNGIDFRPYQPWMDNFQYANYVAISCRIADSLR